ncbi:MAG: hypothetical protein LUH46_11390 [Alistipes sp.]|nr:hypothetical protein [Alistipes sp.]
MTQNQRHLFPATGNESAENLIEGCTARFDPDTKILSVSIYGKEIISKNITEPDENDYWIGYNNDGRNMDFNICLNKQTNLYELTVYPVIDQQTDRTIRQNVPLAFDLAGEIKNLLRLLGTKELDMDTVENSSMALWWDNHGDPHETTVRAVGIDDKDDLYLTLDDDCGGDVQIWESCGHLSDNDLELVLENIREYMARRSDPDRVAITDDVDEVVEIITTPTINPEMFRRRVKCLMLSGLSQEKAEQTIATTPLKLSLFYDIGRGAFAIDAEAVGNALLYNPYTGKEIPDETE